MGTVVYGVIVCYSFASLFCDRYQIGNFGTGRKLFAGVDMRTPKFHPKAHNVLLFTPIDYLFHLLYFPALSVLDAP